MDGIQTEVEDITATPASRKYRANGKICRHSLIIGEMESEQLPAHGGVGKPEVDVALDAPQQGKVVVLKQVGGDDHHPIKLVQLLHQRVAVLVDMLLEQVFPAGTLRNSRIYDYSKSRTPPCTVAALASELICLTLSPRHFEITVNSHTDTERPSHSRSMSRIRRACNPRSFMKAISSRWPGLMGSSGFLTSTKRPM